MLEDFLRLTGSSVGLAKDISVETFKHYVAFIKRIARPSATIFFITFIVIFVGAYFDIGFLSGLCVLIAGCLALFWVTAAVPLITSASFFAGFEFVKRILRVMEFIAIWTLNIAVIAFYSDLKGNGVTLMGVTFLSIFPVLLLFGWRGSRVLIGLKFTIIVGMMFLTLFMPKTADSISFFGKALDRTFSRTITPPIEQLKITLESLQSTELFTFDGEPLYWCRQDASQISGYSCYDRPGRDPYTNHQLTGINESIVAQARTNIEADLYKQKKKDEHEKARLYREEIVNREAKNKAEAEKERELARLKQEKIAAERRKFVESYVNVNSAPVKIGLSVFSGNQMDRDFGDGVRKAMSQSDVTSVSTSILKDTFAHDGLHNQLLGGDTSIINKLSLGTMLQTLVVARIQTRLEQNTARQSAVNVYLTMDVGIYDGQMGRQIDSKTFHTMRPGWNTNQAISSAKEKSGAELAEWIRTRIFE